jgi:phospholipase C
MPPIQTVFVIVLENHDWSEFEGNTNAPYLNGALLPMASFCEEYYNPPGIHPSLPNYLWFEAGTNFGIYDDNYPVDDHQNTTNHLVTLLKNRGISWKAYQEDIDGAYVPLSNFNGYAVRHNPFVYFDDVTGTNNPNYAYGIAHVRPYSELAADLTNNSVARYNFITPNVCDDGHDSCPPLYDPVRQTDNWLAAQIPPILNSTAYRNGGALFITWDEGENADGPIGMVVLSPLARGGYSNHIHYTHSSLLRTIQEIFGATPFLADAANAADLSDLFYPFAVRNVSWTPSSGVQLTATGVIPGWTTVLEASTDFAPWVPLLTNMVGTNSVTFTDHPPSNLTNRFYRVVQRP